MSPFRSAQSLGEKGIWAAVGGSWPGLSWGSWMGRFLSGFSHRPPRCQVGGEAVMGIGKAVAAVLLGTQGGTGKDSLLF